MAQVAPLLRRPVEIDPEAFYPEIGVRSFGRGTFHKAGLEGVAVGTKRLFEIHAGDLLFNIVFAWEGAVAVAQPADHGRFGSHRFLTCVCNPELAEPRFLAFYFRMPYGRARLLQASPGGAGRNRTLGLRALEEIRVPVPPLEQQRRLVAQIDRIAGLVDQHRQEREAATAEMDAMLHNAFVRVIDGAPWQPMALVAPLVRREIVVDANAKYLELGIRSFGRGAFHKPPLWGSEVGSKRLFEIQSGDLLFNIVFAWEGAVAVAAESDHGRVGSHRFLTCVPAEGEMLPQFLCFYFLTHEGLAKLQSASPGGAGRNRTLGLKPLSAIKVPVPSFEKQERFVSLLRRVGTARQVAAAADSDRDHLVPALLRRAFDNIVGDYNRAQERSAA